jgi:hypothetical protein
VACGHATLDATASSMNASTSRPQRDQRAEKVAVVVVAAVVVTSRRQADGRGIPISSIRCNSGRILGCGGARSGSIFRP